MLRRLLVVKSYVASRTCLTGSRSERQTSLSIDDFLGDMAFWVIPELDNILDPRFGKNIKELNNEPTTVSCLLSSSLT